MNVVLDTNIIVSAALTPGGHSASIISLVASDSGLHLYYSRGIQSEYQEVLSRPQLKISAETQDALVNTIIAFGLLIEPHCSTIQLSDEDDRIFYDTAVEVNAILITGNIKHFPHRQFIMTPADFIHHIQK